MTTALNILIRLRNFGVIFIVIYGSLNFTDVLFNATARAAQNPSIAYSGRLFGDDTSTRIIIESDKKSRDKVYYYKNPSRIVIELENTAIRFIEPKLFAARGLISELRYGTTGRGKSRIILTLKSTAQILSHEASAVDNNTYRIIYDIALISADKFEELSKKTEGLLAPSNESKRFVEGISRHKVIIDPGHGGVDGGAQGENGIIEKNVTLAFARRLRNALEKSGKIQVILTRDDDRFLALKKRLEITKNSKADLFISIHADSLKQKQVRGATLYTISKKASDKLAKELADGENRVDLLGGIAAEADLEGAVVSILAELAARETKKYSRQFAKVAVSLLKDDILLIKNPHRYAAFGVLKDPSVPSVLLELGYLSNAEDAKLLQSDQWHAKFSNVLAKAIGQYFEIRN